jgi:hypothetical protein
MSDAMSKETLSHFEMIEVRKNRLTTGPIQPHVVESVAAILEREIQNAIHAWFERAQLESQLMTVQMTGEARCGYLTQLFRDLVIRLSSHEASCNKGLASVTAAMHGVDRYNRGYTAPMIVEE